MQDSEQVTMSHDKQQERAMRILEVAKDLLLKWGYKRVTIDDIARVCDIGTGTIYLHWKTRTALFEALLLREMLAVWQEMLVHMKADVTELLLHRMISTQFRIVMRRPLAKALFMGDQELLGKLAQTTIAQQVRQQATPIEFIKMLRVFGLMRSDMELSMQTYAFGATVTGFYLSEPVIAPDDQIALADKVRALASTIQRAFEPDQLLTAEQLAESVAPKMLDYFEQITRYCEQQMQALMVS